MRTIDIIIPVYNTETLLPRCIDSVLAQTHKDWRLWLIDDGSTDRSYEVCCKYAERDPRIHAYTKTNGGAADTRNFGLDLLAKHSQELYVDAVAFCDSDDSIHADYLCELAGYSSDCVVCGLKHIYPTHTTEVNPPEMGYGTPYMDGHFMALFKTGLLNSPCNKLYRFEIINREGLRFDTELYNEDIAFNATYFSHCHSVISLPSPLYNYYHRPGSITGNVPERAFDDYITLHRAMLKGINIAHHPVIDDFVSYQYMAIALRFMLRRQYDVPNRHLRDQYVQRALRAHRPYSKIDAVQTWLLRHRWLRLYHWIFLRKAHKYKSKS